MEPVTHLWLDDERHPPSKGNWTWVKTVSEACTILDQGTVQVLSLDWYLGYHEKRGIEVLNHILNRINEDRKWVVPARCHIHTSSREESFKMCKIGTQIKETLLKRAISFRINRRRLWAEEGYNDTRNRLFQTQLCNLSFDRITSSSPNPGDGTRKKRWKPPKFR